MRDNPPRSPSRAIVWSSAALQRLCRRCRHTQQHTAAFTVMSDSYFPRWRPVSGAEGTTVAPDERLPALQNVAMGAQHVVAMFGSTVLAPLLMGFDPNVAILMSGVGTLIFFLLVGGRVPSYLGSS